MEQRSADPYRHAHLWFLTALGVIVAGFWPSFFRSLDGGSFWHTLHGVTATLWVIAIATQSYTSSRGLLRWHRAAAALALLLLVGLSTSALAMVAVMQRNSQMPPFLPPLLAFVDIPTIAFLLLLVGLAVANVRRPAMHKRYMAATVLIALPPALTRLFQFFSFGFMASFHGSFLLVDAILVALIALDRRTGVSRAGAAYPLTLAFMILIQALAGPVGASERWRAFATWYAAQFGAL